MSIEEKTIDDLIYESGIIAQGCFDKYDVDALKEFAMLVRKDYSFTHAQMWLKRFDDAIKEEREACAKVFDEMADEMVAAMEPSTAIAWVRNRAEFIRARKGLNHDEPTREAFLPIIKQIAEEAGFVTWQGERWNIDDNVVDWANQYDDELVRFYNLTRKQAMRDAIALLKLQNEMVKERHNYYRHAANIIHLQFLEEDDER